MKPCFLEANTVHCGGVRESWLNPTFSLATEIASTVWGREEWEGFFFFMFSTRGGEGGVGGGGGGSVSI